MLCIVLFQFYALGPVAGRLRVVPHLSSHGAPAGRLFSRGVIFTRARVSLALLSLRKNGGLIVFYVVGRAE